TRGRDVSVIFGDGAGAVIVEAQPDESAEASILEVRMHAEGKHARKLWIEAPSSASTPGRLTHEMIDDGRIFPHMEGRYVFKHAVTRMPEVLLETLGAASCKLEDVDLFLFHQANLRINEAVASRMEIPPEKVFNNIQKYGNCSAASIPMLLAEATRKGKLSPGQLVSMTAFGSGFTWASALIRY
ncbi:MAG: 3-oxoacyl-[acyl-carrier-protein] synthase III C-terminal domain-containing protein, partial [Myxococcales bacterium]